MSVYFSLPSPLVASTLSAKQQKGKAPMEEDATSQPHKQLPQDRVEIRVRQPEDAPETAAAHSRRKSVHWAELPPSDQKVRVAQTQGEASVRESLLASLEAKLKPRLKELEQGAPNGRTQPQKRKNKLTGFLQTYLPFTKTGRKQDQPLQTPAYAETRQTKKAELPIPANTAMSEAWKLALEDTEALEVEQKPPVRAHHQPAESSRTQKTALVSEIEEVEPFQPPSAKATQHDMEKLKEFGLSAASLNAAMLSGASEKTIHPEAIISRRPSLKDLEEVTRKAPQKQQSPLSEKEHKIWEAWYREIPTEKRNPVFAPKNLKTLSLYPDNTLPDVAPSGKYPKDKMVVKKGRETAQPFPGSYQNAHQAKWLKLLPFLKANGSRSNSSESLPTLPETASHPLRPEPSQKGKGKIASAVNPTPGKKVRKERMGSVDLSLPFEEAMQKLMDASQTSQTHPPAKHDRTTLCELREDRPTSSERQRILAEIAEQARQLDEDRKADAEKKVAHPTPLTRKTAQKPGFFNAVVSKLCVRLPQPSLSGNTTLSERQATVNEIDQLLKQHLPAPLPINPVEFVAEAPQEVQDLFKRMIQGEPITVPPKPSRSN